MLATEQNRDRRDGRDAIKLWFSGVALVPYLTLAGLYAWFINEHERGFWTAAGVLIGGRVLYAILDSIMSTIAWHANARKRTADTMRKLFENNKMPMRCRDHSSVPDTDRPRRPRAPCTR